MCLHLIKVFNWLNGTGFDEVFKSTLEQGSVGLVVYVVVGMMLGR
jgi:hypothetical protein